MKVYMANYNNGEPYEDYNEWHSEKVYVNKKDCEKEILDNGYIKKDNMYLSPNYGEYSFNSADMEELELIK